MEVITKELLLDTFQYENGKLLWKKNRNSLLVGKEAGNVNYQGYRRISINKKFYLAHRLVWLMHNDTLPNYIDHKDGNKDNNCIENLRAVTCGQNRNNSKTRSDYNSRIKNVRWSKTKRKWEVRLTVHGKYKTLGAYVDIELAQLVAIEARNKFHREYAYVI